MRFFVCEAVSSARVISHLRSTSAGRVGEFGRSRRPCKEFVQKTSGDAWNLNRSLMPSTNKRVVWKRLAQALQVGLALSLAMLASRLETESGSEPELVQRQSGRYVKKTLAVAGVLLAVVGVASMRFNNQCVNLDALQGKSEVEVDSAILKATNKLLKVKNRSLAQSTVVKAMAKAGKDVQQKWEEHHLRKLDALKVVETKQAIDEYNQDEKNDIATNVECSFNVLEAFVSVVGVW